MGHNIRDYIIHIENCSQEEKKKLCDVLESIGERIYPYTKVRQSSNTSKYFVYYIGDWCTTSNDYNREILSFKKFISMFSKHKKNIVGGKLL